MEPDSYTTDHRRYSRVNQLGIDEPTSGSSYAGNDSITAPENALAGINTLRQTLHSSQVHVEDERTATDSGNSSTYAIGSNPSTKLAPHKSNDLLVLLDREPTSPRPDASKDQEEDRSARTGKHRSSSMVAAGDTLAYGSAQGLSRLQAYEEPGDASARPSRPPSQEYHSGPWNDSYLGSRMDFRDNNCGAPERTIPSRAVARSSIVESLERTAPSAGSDTSGRRSPPLERARSNSTHSSRNIREIILPRWQPDVEVTYCPICRTQFSFFVRKHHCRRCGRVVCNACSPHRITIPYQFIVQPPPAIAAPSAAAASHPGPNPASHVTRSTSDFADRNGGMKVRLCNPCVPDPNPLPPQPQPQYSDMTGQVPAIYVNSGSRPRSFAEESTSGSGRVRGSSAASALRPPDQRSQERPTSPYYRDTGATVNPNNTSNNDLDFLHPNSIADRYPRHMPRANPVNIQGSSASSNNRSSQSPSRAYQIQSRGHTNRHQSLSFIPGGSIPNPQPHYRSLLDIGNDQYARASSSSSRPLPPVPYMNEEDECPVCHRVLFSRTLPDFENRRAAHIVQCIDEQITLHGGGGSGAIPRPGAYTSQSQPAPTPNTTSDPLAGASATPIIPHPIPNTPEARAAARERAHAAVVLRTTSSASSTPPARRTGMFAYRASEKDCVDDAECTICLEEFEVGASMARLECFCRFHKKCIQDWFVDHPGRCPVHQHDGYGF